MASGSHCAKPSAALYCGQSAMGHVPIPECLPWPESLTHSGICGRARFPEGVAISSDASPDGCAFYHKMRKSDTLFKRMCVFSQDTYGADVTRTRGRNDLVTKHRQDEREGFILAVKLSTRPCSVAVVPAGVRRVLTAGSNLIMPGTRSVARRATSR